MDLVSDVGIIKAAVDGLRSALNLVKDVQGLLPAGEKKDAIQRSILFAELEVRRAEAEIAKGFGYKLCQCKAPVPTPMVLAGHVNIARRKAEVFECPACGSNDAPLMQWKRLDGRVEPGEGAAPDLIQGSTTTRARGPDYF